MRMLQFWKKEKHKSSSSSPLSSPSKVQQNGKLQSGSVESIESASVGPLTRFKQDGNSKQPCEKSSRLSLEVEDVLANKVALSYLSQFMEARGFWNLLTLWLDLEEVPSPTPVYTHRRTLSNSALGGSQSKLERILHTYILDDGPVRVRLSEDLRAELVASASSSTGCDTQILNNLKEYITQTIKKDVWTDFLKSDWHLKYQIEVMTSGTMTLGDVLYNDQCLASFIEFLEQEDLLCVIEFWLAATSFEKQFTFSTPVDSTQIQSDAIIIYERYLSLQATTPLGISDRIRFAVEEGICGEVATSPQCFSRAIGAVEAFLRTNCLRPFLSSQHYLNLLSEVMSSSRSNHSPASSVTEGSVDTRPPQDPDDLWRRRRQNSGLSFGRIDQLGRYETDIEPEPKSESRLSKVVKMLINRDEHKAQEEMAWRVAEMIVKDITSITMGGNQDSDEDVFE